FWAQSNPSLGVEPIPTNANNTCSATGEVIFAKPNSAYISTYDPDHSVAGTTNEIFGYGVTTALNAASYPVRMSGFVDQAVEAWNTTNATILHEVIDGFAASQLPVTVALAEEFAVFDHWYAGVPGPTFPNRLFLMSATSNGSYYNNAEAILSGYPQKSIFQNVEDNGYTWKNYYGQVPTSLIFKDVRNVADILEKLRPMSSFYSDAAAGTLPTFSMIDPILFSLPGVAGNDNHPPHDIARGELLVKNIYEALRNGPQWNQTLFIYTYDEHGGFHDHVAPPDQGVPSPDSASESSSVFRFDRLGVRVPTIMVSPWIKKGRVVSEPSSSHFEHSSLSATLVKYLGLNSTLTKRDAWAATFDFLFDELSSPRTDCPSSLPSAPTITLSDELADIENEFEEIFNVFSSLLEGKTP
ncbi:hypothetical protein HK405_011860, partial [Cladochytrium tenue]